MLSGIRLIAAPDLILNKALATKEVIGSTIFYLVSSEHGTGSSARVCPASYC